MYTQRHSHFHILVHTQTHAFYDFGYFWQCLAATTVRLLLTFRFAADSSIAQLELPPCIDSPDTPLLLAPRTFARKLNVHCCTPHPLCATLFIFLASRHQIRQWQGEAACGKHLLISAIYFIWLIYYSRLPEISR